MGKGLLPFSLLTVVSLVAVACMGGGRTAPVIPPPAAGGAPPPPVSAGLLAVPVPPGDGWLLGPTPYVTALTPPHASYQTVNPTEATARVDDHLGGGIDSYIATVDGAVAAATLGTDGILHIPLTPTLSPGTHHIQVLVRDSYGNLNEHGWHFVYQSGPPPIVDVGVDGQATDALWVTLDALPAMAQAGNPANWSLTDPVTGLPLATQVSSVTSLQQMQVLRLVLSADVPPSPWLLTLSWGGQSQTYGFGWFLLQGAQQAGGGGGSGPAPGPAPAPFPGPGGGGMPMGGGGGGPGPWTDYLGPVTPKEMCACSPNPGPPLCPVPPVPPVPDGPWLPPVMCTAGNCGPAPPPPPPSPPTFTVSNQDPSEEGDHPTWCAHLASPRHVWYEHFLHNQIMLWDLDVTNDMSGITWVDEPAIPLQTDDPAHAQMAPPHPSPTQQWNLFSWSEGIPLGEVWPLIHHWPRTGKAVRESRMYAPAVPLDPAWPPEIHETQTISHTTGEETHPTFESDSLGQTPVVIDGQERYLFAPSGDWVGDDLYKVLTAGWSSTQRQEELFVMVRGKDNPGILAYTAPDSVYYQKGADAPLTYARGDRAFLSQEVAGPGSPRVMDILLEGGLTKLRDEYPSLYEEAKEKVCDWGRVSATYMVDNPPPGSTPSQVQGKWLGNPQGDPDWSKIYEEAVWFIPIRPQCCEEGADEVWVKLQDDQGHWRIASPDAAGMAMLAQADQAAVGAALGTFDVDMVRPEATHQEHWSNLHPLPGHDDYDPTTPTGSGFPDSSIGIPMPGDCTDSTSAGTSEELGEPQSRTGRFVCLEAEVTIPAGSVVGTKWTFTFEWADPTYGTPDVTWKNPGVECDFGTKDYEAAQPLDEDCANWVPPGQRTPSVDSCTDRIPVKGDGTPWPWGAWDSSNGAPPAVACDNRGSVHFVGDPGAHPTAEPWSVEFVGIDEAIDNFYCFGDLQQGLVCNLHMWVEFKGAWDGSQFLPKPIAGDNATFRASCACKNPPIQTQSDWTPAKDSPLTIWRTILVWDNPMENDPSGGDIVGSSSPSLADPYLMDAFIKPVQLVLPATQYRNAVAAFCTEDEPSVQWFAHTQPASSQGFHSGPPYQIPLHTFQALGVRLVTSAGTVSARKSTGVTCTPNDKHSAVSVTMIDEYQNALWMGLWPTLAETCQAFGIDIADCRPRHEMLEVVVTHELGHNLGLANKFDKNVVGVDALCIDSLTGGSCTNWEESPDETAGTGPPSRCAGLSVMEYSCLFRSDQSGGVRFFNADQLVNGLRIEGLRLFE